MKQVLKQKYSSEKKSKIINRYGKTTADKLLNGYYWVGMTKDMARISLGEPDDINKTVSSNSSREQWVYRNYNVYLYFENNKV